MSSSRDVPPDLIRAELRTVLASKEFSSSERQRRFLSFVVEETLNGRASGIKEAVIALEVFGRDSSAFDPRTDSIVRVEARNLRLRLAAYYVDEGRGDAVRIDLPRGAYIPVFTRAPAAPGGAGGLRRGRAAALAAMLVTALAVTAWWTMRARPPEPALPSIAVLPFLNLGGGPANDYIADGFAEDLTTELARLPGLRVAARTSAFQFRGRSEDVRAIGRKLGVTSVLEGSLRMEPGRVRVTAQLISAQTGFHLWSTAYDKTVSSLPEAQRLVAHAVAETFAIRRDPPARRHLPPADALDAYWRGRYLRSRAASRAEGLGYLERAVKADPEMAEAWAALASTYAIMGFHSELDRGQAARKAQEAARRALALDESIAEAHAALAQVAYSYEHDFAAAERSYQRALALNPSAAGTQRGFALALVAQSRFDEALRRLELARQADPLSLQTGNDLATAYYCARRFDDAIRTARMRLESDPAYTPAWVILGSSLALSGRPRDGAAALEKAATQGRDPVALSRWAHALALAGRAVEARGLLNELNDTAIGAAMVHTGLGEADKAMECLQRAFASGETDTTFLAVEPIFAPLHGQPAFRALCAKLRLPLR